MARPSSPLEDYCLLLETALVVVVLALAFAKRDSAGSAATPLFAVARRPVVVAFPPVVLAMLSSAFAFVPLPGARCLWGQQEQERAELKCQRMSLPPRSLAGSPVQPIPRGTPRPPVDHTDCLQPVVTLLLPHRW